MTELLVMFLISGVILVAIAVPLLRGKIAPNALYGFRIQDTLNDKRIWYAVNTYSAKWLVATGLIFSATCLIGYLIPGISIDNYSLICLAGFMVPMIIGVVFSWKYMKKIEGEVNGEHSRNVDH
jgi:hypothetical protein